MDTKVEPPETESPKIGPPKADPRRRKTWMMVVIVIVVVLVLAAVGYFTIQKRRSNQGDTVTNQTPKAVPQNASSIKKELDSTDVGQIKTTLKGLTGSLSMFNR